MQAPVGVAGIALEAEREHKGSSHEGGLICTRGSGSLVIELLRTFLEVHRARHFGRAAKNLHVGQSTVSARIRQLEERVGAPLFTRDRNDIELTGAGLRLLPHAESLVAGWQRVRQELMAPEGTQGLAVGGVPSLWDPLLLNWVGEALERYRNLTVNAESLSPETLARRLATGSLDLAFGFDPGASPDVVTREVMNLELTLLSSRPVETLSEVFEAYVYVDWGAAFSRWHVEAFPDLVPPRLRLSTAQLAQTYLKSNPGAAYLATSMLAGELARGELFVVPGAPAFHRPVYALYFKQGAFQELIERLLGQF